MNIDRMTMICAHSTHDYEILYKVSLEFDDPLLKEAKKIGIERAKNVDPHAPGGTIRSYEVRKRKNILGVLAEIVMREILNETIEERGIDAEIVSSAITEIQEKEAEIEIDLTLRVGKKILKTEVRSSCLRSPLHWGITRGVPGTKEGFDILGWYTTRTKTKEDKKDYYLRILYNFGEEEAMQYIENGITLYFVGGASRKLLKEHPEAYNTNLDQPGANYRCIKICASRDANKILDEIFS